MAGRLLNRRELRKQTDQAEQAEAAATDGTAAADLPEGAAKRKSGAAAKVKKPRKPKAPARMRALWCIYDGGMKEVALFDYNQRDAAEAKLAAMLDKKKGTFFLQIVKQPMPAAEPAAAWAGRRGQGSEKRLTACDEPSAHPFAEPNDGPISSQAVIPASPNAKRERL